MTSRVNCNTGHSNQEGTAGKTNESEILQRHSATRLGVSALVGLAKPALQQEPSHDVKTVWNHLRDLVYGSYVNYSDWEDHFPITSLHEGEEVSFYQNLDNLVAFWSCPTAPLCHGDTGPPRPMIGTHRLQAPMRRP